jgi:hypothetical protein
VRHGLRRVALAGGVFGAIWGDLVAGALRLFHCTFSVRRLPEVRARPFTRLLNHLLLQPAEFGSALINRFRPG